MNTEHRTPNIEQRQGSWNYCPECGRRAAAAQAENLAFALVGGALIAVGFAVAEIRREFLEIDRERERASQVEAWEPGGLRPNIEHPTPNIE